MQLSRDRTIAIAGIMLLLTSCTVVTKKSKDGEYIFSIKSDGTGVNVQPILPTPTTSADKPTTAPTPKPSPTVSPQTCTKFTYQPGVIGIPAQLGQVVRKIEIPRCKIQKFIIQGEKGVKFTVDGNGTGIAIIKGTRILAQSSKESKGIAYLVLPYTGQYEIEAVSRTTQMYNVNFKFD